MANLLIILGPTASGKTALAAQIAWQLKGEIISADSRQIYRGMDVGTGKDINEYEINGVKIPYHLIDIIDAGQTYNVNLFKEDFYKALHQITDKHKLPILCGGTGMYIHSLLQNHDYTAIPVNYQLREQLISLNKEELQKYLKTYPEELYKHADFSSEKRLLRAIEIADYLKYHKVDFIKRPELNCLVVGLYSEVEARRKRILDRLEHRLHHGLIEEVQNLINVGVSKEMLVFYGLEYKFVVAYLDGALSFEQLRERLGTAICQFAKRQMTFFRKMEKDGVKINWINTNSSNIKEQVAELVRNHFNISYLQEQNEE
ncbi:tRNA (adenosine(37)-N6)-dimethylallyltransferase MiaA [Pedobacter montanisoli]|uniref:tRNA dimethylallyltransferase n=1 Tax=Pedobacter montanisoli TaxID=2923277 RepID=A0ABS9ZXZ6_9SPHI|nr:tRNA (adenosine(37)-N6)-dimethylallyltransferase MiaA [Pedobacter montanisoli]MCJ0743192.1 tRNA (adenosine(37)-N6)-dimethylallyltransferase MiaA [Pedobacter montanisoli]